MYATAVPLQGFSKGSKGSHTCTIHHDTRRIHGIRACIHVWATWPRQPTGPARPAGWPPPPRHHWSRTQAAARCEALRRRVVALRVENNDTCSVSVSPFAHVMCRLRLRALVTCSSSYAPKPFCERLGARLRRYFFFSFPPPLRKRRFLAKLPQTSPTHIDI